MGCEMLTQNEDFCEELSFDSKDEVSSVYESCPGSPTSLESIQNPVSPIWGSDLFAQNPSSIQQRRDNFRKLMGLDVNPNSDPEIEIHEEIPHRSSFVSPSTCSPSSTSTWSNEMSSFSEEGISEENLQCRVKNKSLMKQHEEEEEIRQIPQNKSNKNNLRKRRGAGWLRLLGVRSCIADTQKDEIDDIPSPSSSSSDQSTSGRSLDRIKIRVHKKKSKELSAIFKGQDVKAHDGAILTVRFSPDGKYLATGGEDGVVRIWGVLTGENSDRITGEDLYLDFSGVHFRVDNNCELVPLSPKTEVEKNSRGKDGKKNKSSEDTCVVVPQNMFRISEKPLHEFRGHNGEVLDLNWSSDLRIISSSTDKTVRLWQVGRDDCMKVFQHKNFVTCVQFNPKNENNFVSGSIDGKIRVWKISSCHVIDWVDVREIVTAVCYYPNGKEMVVGTINGNCRFYDVSDKNLQLENEVSLNGKKKSSLKRITGFQFCPNDSKKLMVTSADSKIRILDGIDVISKYKGVKSGCTTPVPARFTPDGCHIIISDEESNIYLFNHSNPNPLTRLKTTSSHERFVSPHASIAVPWTNHSPPPHHQIPAYTNNVHFSSPSGSFSLSEEFLCSESMVSRGTATWPEEKLPRGASVLNKSQYKVLKSACQNREHMWGQVIVTAGWDGMIRVFQNYGLPVGV